MGVTVSSNGLLIVGSLEFGAEAVAAVGAAVVEAAGATANIYLAINAGNHYSADKAKLEGAGNTGGWLAGKDGKVNWKSKPNFGHTFETHGSGKKNLQSLIDRARTTGNNQGQWLDNQKVAEILNVNGEITKPTIIDIPEGVGQVITPTGEIIPATKACVVPSPAGKIRTAYPIIE